MTAQDRKRLTEAQAEILDSVHRAIGVFREAAATFSGTKIPEAVCVFTEFPAEGPIFSKTTPSDERNQLWDQFVTDWKAALLQQLKSLNKTGT
jgi:hypothetical protein